MNPRFSHAIIDRVNAAQDRLIASRLRRNGTVRDLARKNLRRWAARDGQKPRPVFAESRRILEHLTAREIADFLVSGTPMARRLSQSSPFASLLTQAERRAIRQKHEKTRACYGEGWRFPGMATRCGGSLESNF